jgi:transcriptional regulator with XRE-family HTH domain
LTIVYRHDIFSLSVDNSEGEVRHMKVKVGALRKLAKQRGWSIPELAKQLDVDYSYLSRVMNNEKNGGTKVFSGIYALCKQEGLNVDDYIFLNIPLSTNKGEKRSKTKSA